MSWYHVAIVGLALLIVLRLTVRRRPPRRITHLYHIRWIIEGKNLKGAKHGRAKRGANRS